MNPTRKYLPVRLRVKTCDSAGIPIGIGILPLDLQQRASCLLVPVNLTGQSIFGWFPCDCEYGCIEKMRRPIRVEVFIEDPTANPTAKKAWVPWESIVGEPGTEITGLYRDRLFDWLIRTPVPDSEVIADPPSKKDEYDIEGQLERLVHCGDLVQEEVDKLDRTLIKQQLEYGTESIAMTAMALAIMNSSRGK